MVVSDFLARALGKPQIRSSDRTVPAHLCRSLLEASPSFSANSSVRQLESPLQAWAFGALRTPSLALLGQHLLWPGAVPPFTRRLLGAYGRVVHLLVPSGSWSQPMEFSSSLVTRP
jgi:hypothetical protein